MYTKIALRLHGLDLRDPDAYAVIPPELEALDFEANGGISFAVFYTDDPTPVGAAVDHARCILKHLPGVTVPEAYDELVTVADIAHRVGVAAEAVRLWTVGKRRSEQPFPEPRQVVGGGSGGRSTSLWAWRDVVLWVRAAIGIDPDEGVQYLSDLLLADLNAELAGLAADEHLRSGWLPLRHATHEARVVVTENRIVGNQGTVRTRALQVVRADSSVELDRPLPYEQFQQLGVLTG